MAVSPSDIEAAVGLFSDLGDIRTRRMMGGLCLYSGETIFALLHSDGRLLIKGAGPFRDVLDARGFERWRYTRKTGQSAAMPYWTLPEEIRDDPDAACALAREALTHL